LKILIHTLDADLLRVEVISLSDDVFYGNLVLNINGETQQVDCRPSDALALAARTQVPILISEDVMHQAGIIPEPDITDEEAMASEDTGENEPAKEDLDVFEDFLQNFNLDDLGDQSDSEEDDH
jgi:bifunctional DNase/RNase